MYIGAVMPWDEFHQPDLTGITYARLMGLGFMILLFRRIPAILAFYKLMPAVCANYKEALFMGYFGTIGAGAVFYVEHAHHLLPHLGDGDAEETDLVRAMRPVVYWLVLFSIVVHGLSIPALNLIYRYMGVQPNIQEDLGHKIASSSSVHLVTPPDAPADHLEAFASYGQYSQPTLDRAGLSVPKEKPPGGGFPNTHNGGYPNVANGGYPNAANGGYADEVELQKLMARKQVPGQGNGFGVGGNAV